MLTATAAYRLLRERPDLLGRLALLASDTDVDTVADAADASRIAYPLLAGSPDEQLVVIALGRRHQYLGATVLTHGSDGFTIVEPRQIFRWALSQGKSGAAALILAHNHPSGDPTPSLQDLDVTRRVAEAGRILGIALLDHLVLTDDPDRWTSLAECGLVERGTPLEGWTA